MKALRRVPLVLSTILLNFVALSLVSYLTQGPLRGSDPSAAQTDPIAAQGYLPVLVRGYGSARRLVYRDRLMRCPLGPAAVECVGV